MVMVSLGHTPKKLERKFFLGHSPTTLPTPHPISPHPFCAPHMSDSHPPIGQGLMLLLLLLGPRPHVVIVRAQGPMLLLLLLLLGPRPHVVCC
jgi:hypothetical protein